MTKETINASDVIGQSYYIYSLSSSNNNPSLNSTINITCTVTNVYGQAVSGKSITLYQNGTSKGSQTTSSNGTASWNSISMSSEGLQVFNVESSKIEIFVDNKISKSSTTGLVKNDGTIDTTSYSTFSGSYNDLSNKPTIPSASTTTPSADTTSGSYGTGTTWARSNHTHPKSSLYAESTHSHTKSEITDFPTSMTPTSHTHGSLQNGGTLSSDISSVNKIAVTDSSNNLKTISQLPYTKISGTPTIPDVSGKEDSSNKVTSWSSTTTDAHYPSEKLVKTGLDSKQATLVSGTNIKTINNTSLLGSGNIVIEGGGSGVDIATSWGSPLSDEKVPSEKLVKNSIDNKADSSDIPTKTSDLANDGDGTNLFVTNNDSRLTDARTPTSHSHGNLTNDGKVGSTANYFVYTTTSGAITSKQKIGNITTSGAIGSTANLPVITTTSGVLTTGSFGTTANTFCQGNDSRLSDARTPTAHTHTKSEISDFPTIPDISGKADKTTVVDWDNITFVPKSTDSTGAIILNFLN